MPGQWGKSVTPFRFLRHSIILAACVAPLTVLTGCTEQAPEPVPGVVQQTHRRPNPTGADAPLAGLFQALDGLSQPGTAQVTILQLGDSHTANDSFAGAMRDRFQARFGNAGRGYLQPGIPFNWYRPHGIAVQAVGFTSLSSFHAADPGPFGIAATRAEASGPAQATLTLTDGTTLGSALVELRRQPGGGTVEIAADPKPPTSISTAGPDGVMFARVLLRPGATTLSLRALGDGPVRWQGWQVQSPNAGVSYDNLGYVGATVDIMDRWDWNQAGQEIARLHPAMIVIAYGTNEGFKPSLDPAAYAAGFAAKLAALRDAAPDATLLVLGPPDGQAARREHIIGKGRHRHAVPDPLPAGAIACDAHWYIPPHLGEVRALQQSAAAAAGAYWFDWSAPMGGACKMTDWAARTPPLGFPDHVHMHTEGYAITATVLFETLMHRFDRWRTMTSPR